jgi:nucleotide-binding universal stress UspA family protein
VIVTVAENGDEAAARECAEDAMKLARAHECVAANLVVKGAADEMLLGKARDLGCNLIVVGAYGHSRIREMILGSTTHQLIARSEVPVLLVR